MSDLVEEQAPPQATGGPDCWLLVLEDMKDRREGGIAKYGMPVRPFNGRDPLVDAYQECLDMAVYLRQAIEERKRLQNTVTGLVDRVAAQSELLSKKAEKREDANG